MKIALIHDHLAQDGGAEKVLQEFTRMFPGAPIYTLLYDKKNIEKNFKGKKIEASIIQKLPWGVKHYKWYMPFMPMAVEFFDLRGYDVVLSDTSSFAKGVITSPETLHICYCHTPTRYLWSDTHQYINELSYNKYFKKIISLVLNYTRIWDKLAADRVDWYIANSKTAQRRITKYYKRDSEIIYPSIEEKKYYVSEEIKDYYLVGCRLVPYKRIDLAIKAFKKNGKKLKIFGDGIDLERLKNIAGGSQNIEFLGRISDEEKSKYYSEAKAYINPQKEDFGITMVESLASGRPVIALRKGGAREIVVEGETGVFFEEEQVDDLVQAVEKFEQQEFDSTTIRGYAMKFSQKNFREQVQNFINKKYEKFKEEL